ncbi:hypothetical protein [Streptomyces barringtoniae]|uniref:hypothetical protein n=1 Tax=Streptomyces barringtoniae TaxID=2892029 RepID=UPI001E2E1BED|nr:hypothetical protein [Streptomyces barringtoniae]MCC5481141.1 hypothetical protein [Streptomyces barringtoniae]
MTQTFVTATTGVLAVLAAMEHVPRSLTRLIRACIPLAEVWRELTGATQKIESAQDPSEPEREPRQPS